MSPILPALAIFFGESLVIASELWTARYHGTAAGNVPAAIAASVAGALLLVLGYTLGYRALGNIWLVTALSLSSILVVEPTISWLLFREVPTLGAAVALALGVAGMAVALTVR
jgi:hypothetical protein